MATFNRRPKHIGTKARARLRDEQVSEPTWRQGCRRCSFAERDRVGDVRSDIRNRLVDAPIPFGDGGGDARQQQRGGTRCGDHLVGFGIGVQCIAEELRHGKPLNLGQGRDVIDKAFAQQSALRGLGLDEQLGHRRPLGLELVLLVRLHDGALETPSSVPSAWLRNMQVPSSARAICKAW